MTPPVIDGPASITFTARDDQAAVTTSTLEVSIDPPGDGDGDGNDGGNDGDGDGDGGDDDGGDDDGGDDDGPNQAPLFGSVSLSRPLVDIDDQEVTITCNVSDPDGNVAWVTVDLGELNGDAGLYLNEASATQWTLTCSVAPWSMGSKTLTFVARDDDGAETTYTKTIEVQRHPITILRDFAPGYSHALALRDDGTMMAWGDYDGVLDVPQPGRFLKVAAGDHYCIAIREDQTLVGWGQEQYGRTVVPAGTFKAIAAAWHFAVGIRTDGSLQAWGRDHLDYLSEPAGNDFVQVDALFGSAIARRENGTLVVWGPAVDPVLLNEIPDVTGAPVGNGYVDVAAGGYHCLALKADGTLVAWGNNDSGQCNVPAGTYKAVDAGYDFSVAVRMDGSLVAWGLEQYGVIADVPTGNDFVDVWCSMSYGVAKRADGSLVCWGADILAPMPDELQ